MLENESRGPLKRHNSGKLHIVPISREQSSTDENASPCKYDSIDKSPEKNVEIISPLAYRARDK